MRKYMKKEVVFTVVKSARMEVIAGLPQAVTNNDFTVLGKVNQDRAQRDAIEKFGSNTMVYKVESFTKNYRMKVEDFIKYAEEVLEDTVEEDEDEDEMEGEE